MARQQIVEAPHYRGCPNLSEIGKRLGISRERARQLLESGVRKMKTQLRKNFKAELREYGIKNV